MIRLITGVWIIAVSFLAVGVTTVAAQENDREIPRDVLKGIDAMRLGAGWRRRLYEPGDS